MYNYEELIMMSKRHKPKKLYSVDELLIELLEESDINKVIRKYNMKLSEKAIIYFKDKLNWNLIINTQQLSESFIENNLMNFFNENTIWDDILGRKKFSTEFLLRNYKNIKIKNVHSLLYYQKLPDEIIKYLIDNDFIKHNNWLSLFAYQKVPQDIIEMREKEGFDSYELNALVNNQKLSDKFIRKYFTDLRKSSLAKHQKLSVDLIESLLNNKSVISQNALKLIKDLIVRYQEIPEEFIKKYKLNLNDAFKYQRLSESFIDKHKDIVNVNFILKYQKISEDFIDKIKYRFNKKSWELICIYQDFSKDFFINNWNNVKEYEKILKGKNKI